MNIVLVHGSWHTGELWEPVAEPLRRAGHTVHTPTVAGHGFKDEGTGTTGEMAPLGTGPLTLRLRADGPVRCEGPLAIFDVFGEQVRTVQQAWLCRCGASKNKPYCDGSHEAIGFRS